MFKVFWGYTRAVFLAIVTGLVLVFALEIEKIPDSSMQPTILSEDYVFINKTAYLYSEPARGDVVALRNYLHTASGGGALFASRIEGVAGDQVITEDGSRETVRECYVYVVSDGSRDAAVFSAGDRNGQEESLLDSRNSAVGQVAVEEILGRIEWIVWPYNRWGRLS